MPFELKKASCVAVGTFNIYIVQPDWLTKVGIFPEKTEFLIENNLDRPGFRITSPEIRNTWVVYPGKLAIESNVAGEDCGNPMAQVLEKLHWTPVFGLGNNITFEAKRDEIEEMAILKTLSSAHSDFEGYNHQARDFGTTLVRGGKVFNLGITSTENRVRLHGNAHRQIKPDGSGTESAVKEAKAFSSDVQTLTKLMSEVFGVKLP